MASGYKEFVAATVLDAADLTDYCSSQSVMRFANAAGRDAALTVSIVKEGMIAYLQDTNVLQVNTDSTTTGWKQFYPAITASITDAQITNAKMAADSVSSANIIPATIVGGDIAAATITGSNIAAATIAGSNIIDNTITGTDIALNTIAGSNIMGATIAGSNIAGATITGSNIAAATITGSNIAAGTITGANIENLSIGPSDLINGVYTISIDGNAVFATTSGACTGNAATATNAANSALLDGFNTSYAAGVDTIPVRDPFDRINSGGFVTNNTSNNQFYNDGEHTQIGQFTARVVNASTVYAQAVTSARAVLINSAGTLGTSVSSRRYKIDIEPLNADSDKILQLEPVTFYYKPELYESDQEKRLEVGLIAEQAAELGLEQLIHRNATGEPEAIDYEKLAVYLLKVCQTQQTQLDALAARLDKIGA